MENKKLNIDCKIVMKRLFKELRKVQSGGNRYSSDRTLSEIQGFIKALMYTEVITEKQYDMIFDYAVKTCIYGHAVVKRSA